MTEKDILNKFDLKNDELYDPIKNTIGAKYIYTEIKPEFDENAWSKLVDGICFGLNSGLYYDFQVILENRVYQQLEKERGYYE